MSGYVKDTKSSDEVTYEQLMSALYPGPDMMCFVNGRDKPSFRCDSPGCGCNVFRRHRTDHKKYRCNSCGATFTGS